MMKKSNINFHKKTYEILPLAYEELFNAEDVFLKEIIVPNSTVCDIGSGEGRTLRTLKNIAKRVVGIDFDEDAIGVLQSSKEFDDCELICADASALPLKKESFDVVTCMMSWLNFGEKKEKSLQETNRILIHGGSLILSVFHEDAMPTRLQVYKDVGVKIKHILNGKVTFDEKMSANTSEQFSKKEIFTYIEDAGFSILEIKKAGIGYIVHAKKT